MRATGRVRLPGRNQLRCAAMVAQHTMIKPDDWHLHLRDGDGMASVISHSAKHFGRAVIMPNLVPPVTTADKVGLTLGAYAGHRAHATAA